MSCFWNKDGMCRDPVVGNSAASDERCSKCERYRGPHRGLGDVIDSVTSTTGIKSAVKAVSSAMGVDCGCDKRRADLNKAFPISPELPK